MEEDADLQLCRCLGPIAMSDKHGVLANNSNQVIHFCNCNVIHDPMLLNVQREAVVGCKFELMIFICGAVLQVAIPSKFQRLFTEMGVRHSAEHPVPTFCRFAKRKSMTSLEMSQAL